MAEPEPEFDMFGDLFGDMEPEAEPAELTTPRPAQGPPTRAELEGMKLSALKKRAKDARVDAAQLEEADDADDIKAAVIGLILAAAAPDTSEEARQEEELRRLRDELQGMKLSAVKKRAKQIGVDEQKLEQADDADDIKSAVIDLIIELNAAASGGAARQQELQQLRAELEAMKLSALKKKAKEVGVEEDKLEKADDADDIKAAVIDLILAQVAADPAAAAAAARQEQRVELEAMKVSALKKRAKQTGVEEAKLEEADDADNVKMAVIDLILALDSAAASEPEPEHDTLVRMSTAQFREARAQSAQSLDAVSEAARRTADGASERHELAAARSPPGHEQPVPVTPASAARSSTPPRSPAGSPQPFPSEGNSPVQTGRASRRTAERATKGPAWTPEPEPEPSPPPSRRPQTPRRRVVSAVRVVRAVGQSPSRARSPS